MAVVCGDIHGNLDKVRAFLAYRPEELHIALGDYVDSFHEPQDRQLEALQMLLDSKAILLWGNHDLHYLKTAPWFCTGRQWTEEWVKKYVSIVNLNKKRFMAAHAVDGWLLTHAGCSTTLAAGLDDVTKIADTLNRSFSEWLKKPVCFQFPSGRLNIEPDSIFNIGMGRGGGGEGGIFWFDYKREFGLAGVKQIFGHTETKDGPVVTEKYICLDTTNNQEFCWLYDTALNELVRLEIAHNMHEEVIDGMRYKVVGNRKPLDNKAARISDLPDDEQGPFYEYLICKTVPFVGGYWPADYRRWKAGDGMIKTDSKGRKWDTEAVRLDAIEFALEYPKYAGFTPSRDDVEFFHLHRPERELEIRLKNTPRMRDLPVEELEPFLEWMMGQTRPCIEGVAQEDQDFYYEHDYRRWKAGLQHFDHDLSKVYRKELLDLRREVKSLLGRAKADNAWFGDYNFHPDDLFAMSDQELLEKIEVFKGLAKRLQDVDVKGES